MKQGYARYIQGIQPNIPERTTFIEIYMNVPGSSEHTCTPFHHPHQKDCFVWPGITFIYFGTATKKSKTKKHFSLFLDKMTL